MEIPSRKITPVPLGHWPHAPSDAYQNPGLVPLGLSLEVCDHDRHGDHPFGNCALRLVRARLKDIWIQKTYLAHSFVHTSSAVSPPPFSMTSVCPIVCELILSLFESC